MSARELTGRTALVTGVSRRAGIGASIARELGRAGARLFVTFFRHYDEQQIWGVEPNEPELLLSELGSIADDVVGMELDLSLPVSPADLFSQARQRLGQIDSYIVQANTNLGTTNWVPISTNTAPFTITDTAFTNNPQRFYRAGDPTECRLRDRALPCTDACATGHFRKVARHRTNDTVDAINILSTIWSGK